MTYVMSMEIEDFILLIIKSIEKREEHKAWDMWLTRYQHMDKKNFVPFSQFFKSQKQQISQRPTEDILAEAEEIRNHIRMKSGG